MAFKGSNREGRQERKGCLKMPQQGIFLQILANAPRFVPKLVIRARFQDNLAQNPKKLRGLRVLSGLMVFHIENC
jgi:hypothetical protein